MKKKKSRTIFLQFFFFYSSILEIQVTFSCEIGGIKININFLHSSIKTFADVDVVAAGTLWQMKRKQVGKVEKFNDIERKKSEQEEGNAFDIIGIKWQVKFPIYEIKKKNIQDFVWEPPEEKILDCF